MVRLVRSGSMDGFRTVDDKSKMKRSASVMEIIGSLKRPCSSGMEMDVSEIDFVHPLTLTIQVPRFSVCVNGEVLGPLLGRLSLALETDAGIKEEMEKMSYQMPKHKTLGDC